MVDELDPEALVGPAVVGPGPGDRRRHRSIILNPARPHLRREWVRLVRGLDPGKDRIIGLRCRKCHAGASRRVQRPRRVKQFGVVRGAKETRPPIRGKGAIGGTRRIGAIEEPAHSIVNRRLVAAAGDKWTGRRVRTAIGRGATEPALQVAQAPRAPVSGKNDLIRHIGEAERGKIAAQVGAADRSVTRIGRPYEKRLAIITRTLSVAVELRAGSAVVRLRPNLGGAAGPRRVGLARGIGRVAVQFPQDIGAAAAEHVVDGLGIDRGAATGEQRHIPARRCGVGSWRQSRCRNAARRDPGLAAVRARVGIERADQWGSIGGILIETIDICQGIRRVGHGGIAWTHRVIVVTGRSVRAGPDQDGAARRIVAERRHQRVGVVGSARAGNHVVPEQRPIAHRAGKIHRQTDIAWPVHRLGDGRDVRQQLHAADLAERARQAGRGDGGRDRRIRHPACRRIIGVETLCGLVVVV